MKKYFIFFFLIIAFLFCSASFVFALEIPLPGLPENPSLEQYVSYIFNILIGLAGILSLISFTIGAIGLINPNVEAHNEAKDRMKGAALGLTLTLVSFLILQTINPALVNIIPTTPETGTGVFLTGTNLPKIPCPIRHENASTLLEGYSTIEYICPAPETPGSPSTPPGLLVWLFPLPGLEAGNGDLSDVTVQKIGCGQTLSLGENKSFMRLFETPGVYYYLNSCSDTEGGYASGPNTTSQNLIQEPFKGKQIYVKIVNDPDYSNIVYGVILHSVVGLENGGLCTAPVTAPVKETSCYKLISEGVSAFAADIFNINQDAPPDSSGDGVVFYSAPFEDAVGARAGYTWVKNDSIKSDLQPNSAPLGAFAWTGINRTQAYKENCDNGGLSACPGSIDIKGDYLVALYSQYSAPGGVSSEYCQTFTKDIPNLKTEPFLRSESPLTNIYIIPTGIGGGVSGGAH